LIPILRKREKEEGKSKNKEEEKERIKAERKRKRRKECSKIIFEPMAWQESKKEENEECRTNKESIKKVLTRRPLIKNNKLNIEE